MHTSRIYFHSLRQSGLEFATATDGTSEWVRPEDVERFKKDGGALLGKDTKVSDAEKGAHKTALLQFQAMRQQQEQISDEVSTGKDQAPMGAVVQKPEGESKAKVEGKTNASENKDPEKEEAQKASAASRPALVSFGDRSCVICSLQ